MDNTQGSLFTRSMNKSCSIFIEEDPFSKLDEDENFKKRFASFVENFCEVAGMLNRLDKRLENVAAHIRDTSGPLHHSMNEFESGELMEVISKKLKFVSRFSTQYYAKCGELDLITEELYSNEYKAPLVGDTTSETSHSLPSGCLPMHENSIKTLISIMAQESDRMISKSKSNEAPFSVNQEVTTPRAQNKPLERNRADDSYL